MLGSVRPWNGICRGNLSALKWANPACWNTGVNLSDCLKVCFYHKASVESTNASELVYRRLLLFIQHDFSRESSVWRGLRLAWKAFDPLIEGDLSVLHQTACSWSKVCWTREWCSYNPWNSCWVNPSELWVKGALRYWASGFNVMARF